ncbi:calcium-binding protein [Ponticoccus litoralis]|uniref:Calcium-binding protein n=1 Tax=Ponticoccus litoralis TaxID=422297 RepID=A0AAW9ST29_9RHOB
MTISTISTRTFCLASGTQVVLFNPATDHRTTITGTGFQFLDGEPSAGVVSGVSVFAEGAVQGTVTGINWGLVDLVQALDAAAWGSLQPLADLFNSGGPITLNAAGAGAALDMTELLDPQFADLLTQPVTVRGSGFDDVMFGGINHDILRGGAGEDAIWGGQGNDLIEAGGQYDTVHAGAGNDTVYGGDGRDLAFLSQGNDIFHDNAQGGEHGQDTVFAGFGDDTIEGGNGDDAFYGEDGADLIFGRLGNDLIHGGGQYDTIHAGEGDDTVHGGDGRDMVRLNQGNDIFHDNTQGGEHEQGHGLCRVRRRHDRGRQRR